MASELSLRSWCAFSKAELARKLTDRDIGLGADGVRRSDVERGVGRLLAGTHVVIDDASEISLVSTRARGIDGSRQNRCGASSHLQ
jgi:hypothetical protein